jgi:hypothetical protein
MAVYRAQIGFPLDSALPRDIVTVNPHYNGGDAQGLADRLKANLIANVQIGASQPFTIKIYDAKKAPPSYPLATATNGTGFVATTHPRELGLCLSYYAQWNRPTFRGRVYIPCHFLLGSVGLRPTSTQIANALAWKDTLTNGLPSGTFFVVYSRKTGQDSQVTNWWVDDEWDVTRSRGLKPTTRSVA